MNPDLSSRMGHDWGDYADLIVNRAASCGRIPSNGRVNMTNRNLDFDRMMEEAMGPRKNPLRPEFSNHNCWKCRDGELPCVTRSGPCEYLHARND